MDITSLAQTFGPTVAILLIGVGGLFSLYRAALAAKDKVNQQLLDDKDEQIEDLKQQKALVEARLFRVLDRGEQFADLAGAPQPPPIIRRRRSEV